MKPIKIKKCSDCPYMKWTEIGGYYHCATPQGRPNIHPDEMPKWCPLKDAVPDKKF